jgi:pimeloyl-ACP methyl ester carboxylesterase
MVPADRIAEHRAATAGRTVDMVAGSDSPEHHLTWRTTTVDGRPAAFGVAGEGRPLVFLHGWGLAHHAYRYGLTRLVGQRLRVYAPALPGFGGTAGLPRGELTFEGYARWVDRFLAAVGIDGQVMLVGHSFGGGVAIQTAYDWPERVSRLVLINSVGGSAWSHQGGMVRLIRDRPLWDWGLHLPADLLPIRQLTRVVPVIVADALPNLLRNPRAIWDVAHLARMADLTGVLEQLKRRRLPVVILWGRSDKVIPPASLESLCAALGDPQLITVPGKHSWLLADPKGFGEVMTDVIGFPPAARKRPRSTVIRAVPVARPKPGPAGTAALPVLAGGRPGSC